MPLAAWTNFYVITGSAAGALTGLTFVVITLIAQTPLGAVEQGTAAYTTPTIVQFAAVLFVCMYLGAPWPALVPPAVLLGLTGLAGIVYTGIVVRRQRRLEEYEAVLEDLLAYGAGPLVAYTALLVAGILLPEMPGSALFVVGGALMLLLFVAIHNAWDLVTFITMQGITHEHERNAQRRQDERQNE